MSVLFFLLACGLGGTIRYSASLALNRPVPALPWGTFAVNVLGSFALGWCLVLASRAAGEGEALPALEGPYLWVAGFCGGLTTFSTFIQEIHLFHQAGHLARGLIYGVFSLLVGFAAVFFAYVIA